MGFAYISGGPHPHWQFFLLEASIFTAELYVEAVEIFSAKV